MTQDGMLMIAANIDLMGAAARREMLLQEIQTGGAMIEFDAENVGPIALQMAIATRKSLEARAAFKGFGPNAAKVFQMVNV